MSTVPSRRIRSTRRRMLRGLLRWIGHRRAEWNTLRSGTSIGHESSLLAGLRSEHPRSRWESAASLGRHPHRTMEAIGALVQALSDSEEFVRWQASDALARQDSGYVFSTLGATLADSDPNRRSGAARALGLLGGEAVVVLLVKCLTDTDASVRAEVAEALGRVCDPTCADRLMPLLDDASPKVRIAAARALGRIGAPAATEALASSLGKTGQPLLVRRALAAALARAPHPDAQPALLRALGDTDPQVRGYAAQALALAGNEAAYSALEALRSDPTRLLRGTVGEKAGQALSMLERRGRRGIASVARGTQR